MLFAPWRPTLFGTWSNPYRRLSTACTTTPLTSVGTPHERWIALDQRPAKRCRLWPRLYKTRASMLLRRQQKPWGRWVTKPKGPYRDWLRL